MGRCVTHPDLDHDLVHQCRSWLESHFGNKLHLWTDLEELYAVLIVHDGTSYPIPEILLGISLKRPLGHLVYPLPKRSYSVCLAVQKAGKVTRLTIKHFSNR